MQKENDDEYAQQQKVSFSFLFGHLTNSGDSVIISYVEQYMVT